MKIDDIKLATNSVVSLSVPTNVLLFGEYAITQPNGHGISLAMEPLATGHLIRLANLHNKLLVEGITHYSTVFSPPDISSLRQVFQNWLASMTEVILSHITNNNQSMRKKIINAPYKLIVDSSQCFDDDANKRGYGSSAAVSILLTALLLYIAYDFEIPKNSDIEKIALASHRKVQGGGSGYDILCSLYGGTNHFLGGTTPKNRPISLPWLNSIAIIESQHTVQTASALKNFLIWKKQNKKYYRKFMKLSNRYVLSMLQTPDWHEARDIAHQYIKLLKELGMRIGIPAIVEAIEHMPEKNDIIAKAVGAGNELAIVIPDISHTISRPITISSKGLTWHS